MAFTHRVEPNLTLGGFAHSSFDEEAILTIFGGTGIAYFLPELGVSVFGDIDQSASALASLGPFTRYKDTTSNIPLQGLPLGFTFGLPTQFHLHFEASTSGDGKSPQPTTATATLNVISLHSD